MRVRKVISATMAKSIQEKWMRHTPSPLGVMLWKALPLAPDYEVSEYGHLRRSDLWGGDIVPTMLKIDHLAGEK